MSIASERAKKNKICAHKSTTLRIHRETDRKKTSTKPRAKSFSIFNVGITPVLRL